MTGILRRPWAPYIEGLSLLTQMLTTDVDERGLGWNRLTAYVSDKQVRLTHGRY
jgi:hypothetical protein